MKDRAFEEGCAAKLVAALVHRHGLPLVWTRINLAENYKVSFEFFPVGAHPEESTRYGRRPGLEVDWMRGKADVDAWQYAGDASSAFMHFFAQILREKIGCNAEKPSKLLQVLNGT